MTLTIKARQNGPATVLDLSGRIVYGDDTNALRDEVKRHVSQTRRLVLNLADVANIDSGGIGTLLGLSHSAQKAGCDLRLAAPNARVLHVLEITRLLPILGVYANEEHAVTWEHAHAASE